MRPILYPGDETLFTSEGRGRLADCTRCEVTEERNGVYLCEFDYPVTGPMYSALLEGGIVAVIHDDNHDIQPFDIYGHTAPLDGVVTFFASHISYRLSKIILKPMTADSCANALAAFETQTYNRNPFKFWTDKAVTGTWKNDVPSSVKACLGGQQGSILDVYGKGEYEFDKWTVRLYTNRGNDNGVSIRYGVNLMDLTEDVDASEMYTAVAPYWKSADGSVVVTLPEGYVVAGEVPVKTYPWTTETGEIITTEDGTPIEFAVAQIMPVPMDLSTAFQDAPTVEQLRAAAQSRLNSSEAWLPHHNITISFVDLAHTEDYKDVAALQRVSLCDRVNVYCGPLGVTAAKVQVVRVVYNVLTEQYDEIELGQPRTNFGDTIMASVEQLVAGYPSMDVLEGAIDSATRQITGAKGGHIRDIYDANGDRMELVIIDTMDIATARKVWRWNSGGFGYSSNGYAGPYSLAITQDGAIVADFITTGKLSANVIEANSIGVGKLTGTISGGLNNTWVLDLTNGTLTIGNISAANITTGTMSADRIYGGTINGNNVTVTNLSASSITSGTLSADRISGGTINGNNVTITNLSASSITSGTLSADRISGGTISGTNVTFTNLSASSITSGTLSANRISGGTISGTNVTITNLNASNITSGTLSAARIAADSIDVEKLTGTIVGGINNSWVLDLENGTLTIGNISASKITTGTLSADRISGGTIDGNNVTITNLSASNITSGTLSANRISGGTISGTNVTFTNLNSTALTSGPVKISQNNVIISADGAIELNGDISTNGYAARSATVIIGGVAYNFQNGILVENI